MLTERLTPTQVRAYQEIIEICRRCAPHLDRLRVGGFQQEQDEERLAHLQKCAEAVLMYEQALVQSAGESNGRTTAGSSGTT